MKKISNFIQELSLTQQLLVIIFTFSLVFISFFLSLLQPNINNFVEEQMYTVIELAQTNILYSVKTDASYLEDISSLPTNYTIGHVIMNDGTTYIAGQKVAGAETLKLMLEQADAQEIGGGRYSIEDGSLGVYYSIYKDDDIIIISYMYETFGTQLKQTLLSSIINIIVVVVFGLFVLMLLWVATIITPLHQIRIYTEKLKTGQKAGELKITRKDEIGELANALVALSEELDHQEQMKTELIHNISHDLKTPIATIKSYAESIKDGIYPYDTLEKSVDVIIEHADRLEKKVHQLLLLNRLSYEDAEMMNEDESTNMEEVIKQVCLAIKVIKPEIEFVTDIKPGVMFKGSSENWRITVENIVDNALRYAKSTIWITLKDNELIIENDGSHIDENRLRSIFRAYEKGTDGNFGLGLSIAYKVVTGAGYYIEAINTERGVAFKISKPKFSVL